MRKTLIAVAAAAAAVAAVATPASAITRGGELDGDDHPYVGIMIAKDAAGNALWRCSGALVSEDVYVTAGHCVSAPAARAEIWFKSDLEDPSTAANGYAVPVMDGDEIVGYTFDGEVSGKVTPHDLYNDAAFYLNDLGVVEIDEGSHGVTDFADLAPLGYVDTMTTKGRNKDSSKVTAVGYGLQEIVEGPDGVGPDFDPKLQSDKTRYRADLMIVNTKGVAGLGPINPDQAFAMSGDAKHGGTCFGDSGGPILAYGTDIIVGVNSFGLNSNCAGIGGAYRVDRQDDIDFLTRFYTYDS